jgi:hypothetical protein
LRVTGSNDAAPSVHGTDTAPEKRPSPSRSGPLSTCGVHPPPSPRPTDHTTLRGLAPASRPSSE